MARRTRQVDLRRHHPGRRDGAGEARAATFSIVIPAHLCVRSSAKPQGKVSDALGTAAPRAPAGGNVVRSALVYGTARDGVCWVVTFRVAKTMNSPFQRSFKFLIFGIRTVQY